MSMTLILGIITCIYLFLFLLLNHFFGRAHLSNGFWFFLLICLIFITLFVYAGENDNQLILSLLMLCSFFLLFLLLFSVFIVIFRALFNGIKMIRHEGLSLANSLSLLLGISMILFFLFNCWIMLTFRGISGNLLLNNTVGILLIIFDLAVGYFVMLYFNFSFASFFYSIYQPLHTVHYIIILGSGLINGDTVSPLLAGRIQAGIKIYQKQAKRKRKSVVPKLILSGGQGADEKISEAQAMKQYAIEHGVKEEDILIEDQSKNTYENMFNSKKIIEAREADIKKCRILFCTTNYHVFRSAVYAQHVGLRAEGIGASTKGYFRYNATIREFIALIKLHWKKYLIKMVLFIVLCFALAFLLLYISEHSGELQALLQSLSSQFN
jgi:uncharacterized SAM-binding protein YcdF (DUF218 family)